MNRIRTVFPLADAWLDCGGDENDGEFHSPDDPVMERLLRTTEPQVESGYHPDYTIKVVEYMARRYGGKEIIDERERDPGPFVDELGRDIVY